MSVLRKHREQNSPKLFRALLEELLAIPSYSQAKIKYCFLNSNIKLYRQTL